MITVKKNFVTICAMRCAITWSSMSGLSALAALLLAAMLTAPAGCKNSETVTPRIVRDSTASFDGSVQNSGLIGFDDAGNAILTPHARDRFNALVAVYGKRFAPPLTADYGITPTATNTFLITKEALVKFGQMNSMRKAGE